MWRNTAQPVRLFMLDARALLPLLCFVVYWSWLTFYVAAIGVTFFFADLLPWHDAAGDVAAHPTPAGWGDPPGRPGLETSEACMSVSVETVSRTMEVLLTREALPIVYHDIATGADVPVSAKNAASPTGLLPALVVAGEAVWREATGQGFELDIVRDRDACLGFRLRAIGAGSLTTVMLATMEATAQVTGSGVVVVSDLNAVWSAATERLEQSVRSQPRPTPGASP